MVSSPRSWSRIGLSFDTSNSSTICGIGGGCFHKTDINVYDLRNSQQGDIQEAWRFIERSMAPGDPM
jgi:hypothetical protein